MTEAAPANSIPFSTDFSPLQLQASDVKIVEGNNATIQWEFSSLEESPKFEICWWADEADKRSDQTGSSNYMMTKLKYGTKYSVNVTLVSSSAGGVSRASNTVHFDTAPHAPTNVRVENYIPSPEDSIVVSFDDKNDLKVRYVITVESLDVEADPIRRETDNRSALIPNLTAGEMYHVSVITESTGTDGEKLQSKKMACEQPVATFPPSPKDIHIRFYDARLIVTWQRLKNRPDRYEVHWTVNEEKHVIDVGDELLTVEKPASSTVYRFKVAAVNSAGRGDFSDEVTYKTGPAALMNVRVKKNGLLAEHSLIVTFEDPDPGEKLYETTAVTGEGRVESRVETISNTAVLNNLSSGTAYHVYVIAISGDKRSERAYYVKQNEQA